MGLTYAPNCTASPQVCFSWPEWLCCPVAWCQLPQCSHAETPRFVSSLACGHFTLPNGLYMSLSDASIPSLYTCALYLPFCTLTFSFLPCPISILYFYPFSFVTEKTWIWQKWDTQTPALTAVLIDLPCSTVVILTWLLIPLSFQPQRLASQAGVEMALRPCWETQTRHLGQSSTWCTPTPLWTLCLEQMDCIEDPPWWGTGSLYI